MSVSTNTIESMIEETIESSKPINQMTGSSRLWCERGVGMRLQLLNEVLSEVRRAEAQVLESSIKK